MLKKIDRSIIPQPKEEIKFNLPEIKTFLLSNGLKVLFVQRDFLPLIRINLIANCGSSFDPAEKKGLANLFAMMIDEGAGEYNSLELSEEFELLGSSFSATCNHDNVYLSIRALTENFERTLELFSLIILKPRFNINDFQREKRKVEVKLLQQKDDPEEMADLLFNKVIYFHDNSYSNPVLGDETSLANINLEDIKNFYKDYFAPVNSQLIVTGNIQPEKLINLLESNLSSWNNVNKASSAKFGKTVNTSKVYILNKENAVQTEVRIGHQSEKRQTPDYFARTVMNMILGGQFTSRLNLNLREQKGFTYGVSSTFSYYKYSGDFCVSTSVSTENTFAAVNEILNELKKIKDGVTIQELDFTLSSMIRRFPSQFESDNQMVSNLSLLAIHDLPLSYFNNYLQNVRNVTIEEVNKSALLNIRLDELSIVLVGNRIKLLDSFSNFSKGTVQIINENGQIIE